ncbi:hypothetical protein QR721_12635 [Aciduricibacillus chroicocephali]|uniref:Uncharacterized protein n=1 Tax=Aciduricibacillus chroicocephali TaxID=3054939 RepID=A0ABY9KUJ1_9BACI|nr:hypothetical protein QR721_12635 [Bacillaceae bacterium 44XB]
MFVLTRTRGKMTEMLKDSSSPFKKVFASYSDAQLLANQLNSHLTSTTLWEVEQLSYSQKSSLD